jgi:hypothetical protein
MQPSGYSTPRTLHDATHSLGSAHQRDGTLWQEQGRPEVYWIRDGERLHIPNPYVMEALNLDWNAIQTVPQGGLDHIPLDLSWTPLGNTTPGSVVHVPLNAAGAILWNAGKVYWPLPVATTKRLVAWGQEVRTIELQGWIGGGGFNDQDPDFSYHFEVDAGWALARGIDLSQLVKVGNILQLPSEEHDGTADGRAWCAKPLIKLEIVGHPPKGQRDRKKPPDWGVMDSSPLLDDPSAPEFDKKPPTWPFDPTKPVPGNVAIADGDYVHVYGSLVTDKRHSNDKNFPATVNDAIELWKTGLGNNENDDARWTEVHPPDWFKVCSAPGSQVLRGVVVVAPGTFPWRARIESVLDVDIPAPPKPAPNSVLHFREIVGPETDTGTIIEGNATLTGAEVTQTTNPDQIHVHVKVGGRRSYVGGSPGKFRALYWLAWDVPGPIPPGPPLGAGPHRVSCATKHRVGRLTAIFTIGGVNDDGSRWVLPRDAAIAAIDAGTRFYTESDGRRADVVVARRFGRRYLKTRGDSVRRNNLLRLPACS